MLKTLIFSKKKELNSLLISPEDIYYFYNSTAIALSSKKGINFFSTIFPQTKILNSNCFYTFQFISFRISISIIQKQLKLFLKGLVQGFFLEFRIIGLGFKIRKGSLFSEKFIKFDIGFSHFIKFPVAKMLRIGRTKKRFMLFSSDYHMLSIILKNIQNLRKHNPYKMRGLKLTGYKIRLKPGKKQNKR
jgi:ribosomal protein L6P/L9E